MIGKDELTSFKKMWIWLSAHPAHDQDYYMKHVINLKEMWVNGCPLSTSAKAEACRDCELLWVSRQGSLCTDPKAPLFKWKNTPLEEPDKRTYHAIKIAVLAMKHVHRLQRQAKNSTLRRATA